MTAGANEGPSSPSDRLTARYVFGIRRVPRRRRRSHRHGALFRPGIQILLNAAHLCDQYISNIEMNGGKIVYVPIRPPPAEHTHSASEWKLDFAELESKCGPKTKMIVLNTPHNPLGKMFSKEELEEIGRIAITHDLIILSDEVVSSFPHNSFCIRLPWWMEIYDSMID